MNGFFEGESRKSWLIASVAAGILSQAAAMAQAPPKPNPIPPQAVQASPLAQAPPPSAPAAAPATVKKTAVKRAPRARLTSLPTAKSQSKITMDFRDAPVDQILNFFSVVSGLTVIKDPNLQGTATLISPRPLPLDEAFKILEALMDSRGFALERTATMIRINPKGGGFGGGRNRGEFGGAGGFGDGGGFGRGRTQEQTQVFQLKYASAKSIAQIVNDLFKNVPNAGGNSGGGGRGGRGGRGGFNPFQQNANPTDVAANPAATQAPQTSPARASSDDYSNSVVVTGPTDQLTQIGTMIEQIDQPVGSNQVTQVFPLKYIDTTEMANVISNVLIATATNSAASGSSGSIPIERRAFISARAGSAAATNGQVVASPETNSIIVTASETSLDLVQQVIKELDKPQQVQSTTYVRSLQNASATEVAQILSQIYGQRQGSGRNTGYGGNTGSGNTQNSNNRNRTTTNAFGNSSTPRGGSFNTRSGFQKENGASGDASATDASGDTTGGDSNAGASVGGASADASSRFRINPLFVQHTRSSTALNAAAMRTASVRAAAGLPAADDALPGADGRTVLAQFPGGGGFGGGGFGGGGFGGGGFGGGGNNQNRTTTTQRTGRSSSGAVTNVVDPTGTVSAIPDVNTNSLIINADPSTMATLDQILSTLDKVPEQVMIEAVIVEANLDDTTKLGFQFQWTQPHLGNGSAATGSVDIGPGGFTPAGLKYTIVGNNFSAIMQALATDQRFKILSTPRIFTANNREAQINISQQVPYITSTIVDPNGTTSNAYDFLSVGIILDVTPHITGNGLVTIEVNQQANDFQGFTSFNAPLVSQRSTDTTVVVRNGQTVILGGLIRDSVTKNRNKVPILGDLPLIGSLFRSKSDEHQKTELMVFLTPHVVRTEGEISDLTEEQRDQLNMAPQVQISRPRTLPALPQNPATSLPGANGTGTPTLPQGTAPAPSTGGGAVNPGNPPGEAPNEPGGPPEAPPNPGGGPPPLDAPA